MELLDVLQDKIVPGDGAMGTMILEAGVALERCFEELCVSQPDLIRDIHERYVAAGARVIETNSFGANAARLSKYGMEHRVNEINWTAAKLARETVKGKDVFVAGSVGPLGITAEQAREQNIDRKAVFQEQIGALLDGGVDVIFFETFTDLDEMLLALHVKQSLHHLPAICSMACSEEGRLPNGMPLTQAFEKLRVLRRSFDAQRPFAPLPCHVDMDGLHFQPDPPAFGFNQVDARLLETFAKVGKFAPQAGAGLGFSPGSPEPFLEPAACALAIR